VWNKTATATGPATILTMAEGGSFCTDNGNGTVEYSIVSHNTGVQIDSIGTGTIKVEDSITT
jgi:hypothetical protein